MSSSNLIRWSGLSSVIGGILLILYDILEIVLFAGEHGSKVMITGTWFIVQIVILIGIVFLTLGLVGLYTRQAEQAGSLGIISFLLAFAGTMMMFGEIWSESFLGPIVAEEAPALLDAEPSGMLVFGVLLAFVLFPLGYLLFGFASLQTKILPRGAAALLMVGSVVAFVLLFLEVPFALILMGAALVWMGYSLWSGEHEQPTIITEAAT
jgi:hypothetical protein